MKFISEKPPPRKVESFLVLSNFFYLNQTCEIVFKQNLNLELIHKWVAFYLYERFEKDMKLYKL